MVQNPRRGLHQNSFHLDFTSGATDGIVGDFHPSPDSMTYPESAMLGNTSMGLHNATKIHELTFHDSREQLAGWLFAYGICLIKYV